MKIPDCGGSITSEYNVSTSIYLMGMCCTECEWFLQRGVPKFIMESIEVCPSCGSEVGQVVGQYVIETKPKFLWFGGDTKIIAFKRKE
jgi:NAD-dependent SIR2 family protein deacetylase